MCLHARVLSRGDNSHPLISYAAAAIAQARENPDFLARMGIHAAAEAINGTHKHTHHVLRAKTSKLLQKYEHHVSVYLTLVSGAWLTPNETQTVLDAMFNDVTQICSLSGFNTSVNFAFFSFTCCITSCTFSRQNIVLQILHSARSCRHRRHRSRPCCDTRVLGCDD